MTVPIYLAYIIGITRMTQGGDQLPGGLGGIPKGGSRGPQVHGWQRPHPFPSFGSATRSASAHTFLTIYYILQMGKQICCQKLETKNQLLGSTWELTITLLEDQVADAVVGWRGPTNGPAGPDWAGVSDLQKVPTYLHTCSSWNRNFLLWRTN